MSFEYAHKQKKNSLLAVLEKHINVLFAALFLKLN